MGCGASKNSGEDKPQTDSPHSSDDEKEEKKTKKRDQDDKKKKKKRKRKPFKSAFWHQTGLEVLVVISRIESNVIRT